MSDPQDHHRTPQLYSQGGQAASSEPLWLQAYERRWELRGSEWSEDSSKWRAARKVLQRASREEGEPQAGVHRYVRWGEPLNGCVYSNWVLFVSEMLWEVNGNSVFFIAISKIFLSGVLWYSIALIAILFFLQGKLWKTHPHFEQPHFSPVDR